MMPRARKPTSRPIRSKSKEPGYTPQDIDQRWQERLAAGRKAEARRRRRQGRSP